MSGKAAIAEISQPYAQALMSVARSHDLTEQVGEDVRSLLNLLRSSEQLRNFSPIPLSRLKTKGCIEANNWRNHGSALPPQFFDAGGRSGRILLLEGIAEQYLTLLRQLNQTVLAEVISAVELTEAQQQAVQEKSRL
jgi:F-type H+-transporting ATPase subunit delta